MFNLVVRKVIARL